MNKKYAYKNKKINKKQRADIKSAHKKSNNLNNRNTAINLDNEIIIGIPNIDKKEDLSKASKNKEEYSGRKNSPKVKNANIKKSKSKNKKVKKIKKLTEKQIKRRKFILKIIKWTSLCIIIIGTIICIMISPIFNIKNIEVKNNQKISSEQIISLSGVKLDENTFKYSKRDIKKKIKENAYIDSVKITRGLPDTLKIEVKERTAKLMLLYGNAYVYINNQGYILEISDEKAKLPVLKGYKTDEKDIVVGQRLCNEDLEMLSTVLKIMEVAQSEEIFDKITGIDIRNKSDYEIEMENEQKTAHLGDCSMLEERILWVKTILNETKDLQGEIFVNMNLNSDRPFFRERV